MSEDQQLTELMEDYQKGDPGAFEQLYFRLKARLYHYLVSQSLDRSRSEDLLQETFLQIHRSRKTYLPGKKVLPWAFAIARHVYLMDRRSRRRRETRETQPEAALPDLPIPPDVEKLFDRELVSQVLATLPDGQRQVLLMHHVWGLGFGDIGAVLGIRAGTAKVRAHRGIVKLRQTLEQLSVTESKGRANRTEETAEEIVRFP